MSSGRHERAEATDEGIELIALREGADPAPLFVIADQQSLERLVRAPVRSPDDGTPIRLLRFRPDAARQMRTIPGMAARLLRRILQVQPTGPYRLAGWRWGCLLAYEVAVQLHAADQDVAFVAMVDARCRHCNSGDPHVDPTVTDPLVRAVSGYDPPRSPLVVHVLAGTAEDGVASCGSHSIVPAHRLRMLEPLAAVADPEVAALQLECVGGALARPQWTEDRLTRLAERSYSPLVTIRTGAAGGARIVCVPAAGASVSDFISLRGAIGSRDWLFGLQARGMDDTQRPHSTVEAAASCHVQALLANPGPGEVHLIGHSFGGWVAFEMALRLRSAGRPVASLTLLDSECPYAPGRLPRDFTRAEALMELVAIYEETGGRSLGIEIGPLDALDAEGQLALVHRQAIAAGVMPRRSSPDILRGSIAVLEAAQRCTYLPAGPLEGVVRVILVPEACQTWDEATKRFVATIAGWRRFAPDLRAMRAEGTHMTLLKAPHVASWAHGFTAAL